MTTAIHSQNAAILEKEFRWFTSILEKRVKYYVENPLHFGPLAFNKPPSMPNRETFYAKTVGDLKLKAPERLVVMLALAAHIRPRALDVFYHKHPKWNKEYTIFGIKKEEDTGTLYPTGETAMFLLAGTDFESRFDYARLFDPEHPFAQTDILRLENTGANIPQLCGKLVISDAFLSSVTTGRPHRPEYSTGFPAKRISTPLEWEDLVVAPKVLEEIKELQYWITHKTTIREDWGLGKKIRDGYRALFYGPSGTGKTLTASLLGKSLRLNVYRIDLSMLISKYIGETEKNLAHVFDQARHRDWILFFDEAEALFGKRTQTKDAHDRYANQEVAYLLQRIEDFTGMVILATNQRDNIDKAFARRFQSMIEFPVPGPNERLRLWKAAFSEKSVLDDLVNLSEIAEKYEVSGGMIINILRYASLMALSRAGNVIRLEDLTEGIRREFKKAGKLWITPV